jgi:predicted ATPase/DNA-binding SARP family transcriptional activator
MNDRSPRPRLHDLGPLEVSVGDSREPIRGRRPAAILTLLAIHANQLVPVDSVVDAVWGGEPSAGASSTLDSHVFRLRKQLEPGRVTGAAPSVLLKQDDGFRLRIAADELDSSRFASLLEEAGAATAAGRFGECLQLCDEALTLWRGAPGGAIADAEWAQAWVAGMIELRTQLRERRLDALIRSGSPERALPEFDTLIQETPFREHLHALRMEALYRCGRTDDALATYEQVRRTLRDELGITPGPELRRVHRQILDHDVALGPRARPATAGRDIHLPATMTALVGREADLDRIGTLLAAHRLVTLTGTAGTGKTRLGVEVARRFAERYPDGVWFVDLAPLTTGKPITEVVLSTIGGSAASAGSAEEALRSAVRDRRLLLVVDNCEHVLVEAADVLTTVLASSPELTVLATSREALELEGEVIYPVEPLALGDSSAVELFLERLGAAAPGAVAALDPGDLHDRAVEICTGLDGLPLAIELAAARARVYTLDEIRNQVRFDPTQLARIGRPGTARRQSLQSALDWGHRLLTPQEQLVHRRLAALPGSFGVDAAAATVGLPLGELADLLPMLVNRSLLTSAPAPRTGGPTLFRQLVVVRGHAARALTQAGETGSTLDRRDEWVAALATVGSRTDRLELRRRYIAVDDDYAAVRATLQRTLVDQPCRIGARTAGWLHGYWYYRGQLVEAVRWLELAEAALGAEGEAIDEAWVHIGLAKMLAHQGRVDRARHHSELGLAVADRIAPEHLGAFGLDLAIQAGNLWSVGDPVTARHLLDRTTYLAAAAGDPVLEVLADATRSLVESDAVEPAVTLARAEQLYPRALALDLDVAAWMVARAGSHAALAAGDAGTGMRWSEDVIALHLVEGGEFGGAFVEMRANFLALAGDHRAAVRLYSAARAQRHREGLEWRTAPETDELRERARVALDPAEYERAWREGTDLPLSEVLQAGDAVR